MNRENAYKTVNRISKNANFYPVRKRAVETSSQAWETEQPLEPCIGLENCMGLDVLEQVELAPEPAHWPSIWPARSGKVGRNTQVGYFVLDTRQALTEDLRFD